MFQKTIGKTCRNPECQFKDQLKESSMVMCECGHALEDVTVTDRTKIIMLVVVVLLVLGTGGYMAVMKLKKSAEETLVKTGKQTSETANKLLEKGSEVASKVPGASSSAVAEPKAAIILVSEGLKLIKEDKFQEAMEKFQAATEKDSNNDQAFGNLGASYKMLGKGEEALNNTLKAVALNPKNPIWHLNLAELYSIKGDKEKALIELGGAFKNGFSDKSQLRAFNFKNIEKDPKFKELIDKN